MNFNLEATLWYLFALDCIGANLTAWFFKDWYDENLGKARKYFPATKCWCFAYLCLMLWLGWALLRQGTLPW